MPRITWDDFADVDIRVGRVVQVDDFPKVLRHYSSYMHCVITKGVADAARTVR